MEYEREAENVRKKGIKPTYIHVFQKSLKKIKKFV